MGVGVQGEAGGEVAEHTADCFNVYAILQGDGGEGMTEVVESDLWDTCSRKDSLQYIVDAVGGDETAVGGEEDIYIIRLRFLLFQNFYRLG